VVCSVQAQKFSVQKQLRKRFQRFMVSSCNYNSLLLTVLHGMAREADRVEAMTQGEGAYAAQGATCVERSHFEERAGDYNVAAAVEPFYASALFREAGYSLSDDGQSIVRSR
jgi:hypothetical protein